MITRSSRPAAPVCEHLAELLAFELETGNHVDAVTGAGTGMVVRLATPLASFRPRSRPPVTESVVAHPGWWGRELHCPEHHQRLAFPA